MCDLRERLRALPKADLHNHMTLGPSLGSLGNRYPGCALAPPLKYEGLEGMEEYIHREVNRVMATGKDVVAFMETAARDSVADGVTLLEASVDTGLARYFDGFVEPLIEEVARLKAEFRSRIELRPDVGLNKRGPVDIVCERGRKCIESGVFSGVDLYGLEKGMRLEGYVDLYRLARERGLKTKVHIGEFSDWRSIEEAVELLEPDEIQHGINATQSESTMDLLLEKDIRLNLCPRSNIALGAARSLREHPIRTLYDRGVRVTINTDDLLLFGATVTDQYLELTEEGVFSSGEIDEIRLEGLKP